MSKDKLKLKGNKVREINSLDGHLIVDGGVVSKTDNGTVVVQGEGWTLAIALASIVASPYGFLVQAEPKVKKVKKVKAKATKDRKPKGSVTRNRVIEVKRLKGLKQAHKEIGKRVGLAPSTVGRIVQGKYDCLLSAGDVPAAAITPVTNRGTGSGREKAIATNEHLHKVEAFIKANPTMKTGAIAKTLALGPTTIWRVRTGQYCLQLKRKG